MWDTNGRKIKRFLVWLTRKNKKSGKKYKKAVDRYILILKKEAKGNEKNRVKATKPKALNRLKRYGIKQDQIKSTLEKKWLKELIKLID